MQMMPPFYLLFWYMAADADVASADQLNGASLSDSIANAMRRLDGAQRLELVQFCDELLSSDADFETLARVFEDGHLHHVWRTSSGPRQYLALIRDIADKKRNLPQGDTA
jgi:hypothetical protein